MGVKILFLLDYFFVLSLLKYRGIETFFEQKKKSKNKGSFPFFFWLNNKRNFLNNSVEIITNTHTHIYIYIYIPKNMLLALTSLPITSNFVFPNFIQFYI